MFSTTIGIKLGQQVLVGRRLSGFQFECSFEVDDGEVELRTDAGQKKSQFLSSLRRKGLDAEVVTTKFKDSVATSDDLFGLYQEYLRWWDAETTLKKQLATNSGLGVDIERLRTALERERAEKKHASTTLPDELQKEVDLLVAEAGVNREEKSASPIDALALETAADAVRTAMKSRQSRLGARPAMSAHQLPALPELKYSGIDDSAEILLTRLREKVLPDYKRRAVEQLANQRTEEALLTLSGGCDEAIRQLEAFRSSKIGNANEHEPSGFAWRREALKALRDASKQLQSEVGGPYYDAANSLLKKPSLA